MANLTGKDLAKFVQTKIGTPYVYGAKLSYGIFTKGQLDSLSKAYPSNFTSSYIAKAKKYVGLICTDCSGLIAGYTGKLMGSAQMYSSASKRGLIVDVNKAPVGAVLWHTGHVGVKIDDTYCVEAKGINYGTVKSKIKDCKWTHWLLFDYMEYEEVKANTTNKPKNPYAEPAFTIKKGMNSEFVKWVQFELLEAGYVKFKVGTKTKTLTIDGDFGDITETAVRLFQTSCKLEADGKVGTNTIKALKNN